MRDMKTGILLSKVAEEGKFKVKNFNSCLSQRRRLCALGFTQGTEFELKRRDCCGACSVEVRGCRFVLDPDTANSIICEPLLPEC